MASEREKDRGTDATRGGANRTPAKCGDKGQPENEAFRGDATMIARIRTGYLLSFSEDCHPTARQQRHGECGGAATSNAI